MCRTFFIISFWMVLFCVKSVSAQFTVPPYRHFTLQDGLPQMQVISLFQDSRGYIWAGTKDGICYYNGKQIRNFSGISGQSNDLIYSITEDSSGNIWYSVPGELIRYDGSQLTRFAADTIRSCVLTADNQGRIWFLGHNGNDEMIVGYIKDEVFHFHPHNLQPFYPGLNPDIAWSEQSQSVLLNFHTTIYEVRDGEITEILSGTEKLIFGKLSRDSILIVAVNTYQDVRLFLPEKGNLVEIAQYKSGKNIKDNLLRKSLYFSENLSQTPVLMATPTMLEMANLAGVQKNCFLHDRDGQIWIGSEEGLYLLQDNGFETYRSEYFPQVWSVSEDKAGDIWFASFHFDLKRFNGKAVQSYPELKPGNKAANFYFRISADKNGHLFFPNGYGILQYDGHTFTKITDEPALSTFYDEKRDLLLGGFQRNFQIFGPGRSMVRRVGEEQSLGINRWVVAMGMDAEGWYWIGSLSGISRYHYDSGEIIIYNHENGRLPAVGITAVHTDMSGRTWMGSTGGLLWYNPETREILKMEHADLQDPVNLVSSIDTTWLVVSQPEGIYLLDMVKYRQNGSVRLYFFNRNNGYLGIEPGQDGAFKDSKGNIWMTSSTEVVRLDPSKLRVGDFGLEVRISAVNDILLAYHDKTVRLERNQQTAIVAFDAICFNRPKPTQYSWRVAGRNGTWSAWREEEYAVITDLPSGTSALELRARTPGLALEDYAMDSIKIVTAVVVWKQAWFFQALFGLFAFLVIMALLLIFRYRAKITKTSRDARIAQIQAIQSQMNPHFVFNALASSQTMILNADIHQANSYLLKLSNLIRGFLDASAISGNARRGKKFSEDKSLAQELEVLENYVDFQQLIYPGRFDYRVFISPDVDVHNVRIPPMLIQPFIENAIRHGLLPKHGRGILSLTIGFEAPHVLRIQVADDGIGIRMAEEKSRKSTLRYVSRGRELTINRISLLNELGYKIEITTQTSDEGTTVTLKIHIHDES